MFINILNIYIYKFNCKYLFNFILLFIIIYKKEISYYIQYLEKYNIYNYKYQYYFVVSLTFKYIFTFFIYLNEEILFLLIYIKLES